MNLPDYYSILQVSESADARTIKIAYRRLALQYHPDTRHPEASQERMQMINEAYEILSDYSKRHAYDNRSSGKTGYTHRPEYGPPPPPTEPPGPFVRKLVFEKEFRHFFGGW
jgi:DnaJ-class molecular chaperone